MEAVIWVVACMWFDARRSVGIDQRGHREISRMVDGLERPCVTRPRTTRGDSRFGSLGTTWLIPNDLPVISYKSVFEKVALVL